jgi:diguanylate cyclase (GGDEF)-like protein
MADYATGPDFEFSLLYLVPVLVLAWREDGRVAIGAAVLAAACAITADAALHGVTIFTLWNGFTRLGIYVALAVLGSLVHSNRERLATMNVRLARLLEEEQRLARTDTLTGLANSRAFSDALHRAIARNRRDRTPLAVACFDLDNFKSLNDAQGHAGGDRALLAAAGALTRVARSADLAARIGGDEFAVLLPEIDQAGVEAVAHELVAAVAAHTTRVDGRELPRVTISLGVATFGQQARLDREALVIAADVAMYRAKEAGRNGYAIAEPKAAAPGVVD